MLANYSVLCPTQCLSQLTLLASSGTEDYPLSLPILWLHCTSATDLNVRKYRWSMSSGAPHWLFRDLGSLPGVKDPEKNPTNLQFPHLPIKPMTTPLSEPAIDAEE